MRRLILFVISYMHAAKSFRVPIFLDVFLWKVKFSEQLHHMLMFNVDLLMLT